MGAMGPDRAFASAVDAWLGALLLLIAAMVPALFIAAVAAWNGDPAAAAGLAASAAFVAAIMVGLVWPVRYTCASDALVVRSGAIRYRVPYREISRVSPSRAMWSSPALSLDRLRIDYGARWLLISPTDRGDFLAELRRRAPQLRPTAEGGLSS
jgi:hypothetical protein